MAKYIEVDVQAGGNCDYSLNRMFSAVSDPKPVNAAWAPDARGGMGMHQVTGWSNEGPCPAYAVLVEDSGEGQALLLYGGDDGIRLKRRDSDDPWSLDGAEQWGEPCLLLDVDTHLEVAKT